MEQHNSTTHTNGATSAPEIGRQADRPVVAVVATPDNAEDVASTILRGQTEGYETIVCHAGDETLEAVSFAEQLGMPTIEVDLHQEGGPFASGIAREAREIGYPGVLLHECPGRPVDFETSTQRLREDDAYLTEAVPAPRVDSESEVLVAIPAYNEERSIADVVRESLNYAHEVVVIDDGSTDDTVRLAEEAGATVIQHEVNKGYGGALKTAFTEAKRCRAEHLVVLDGDGQHDPDDIPKLVNALKRSNAEIVVGSRSVEGAQTDMPLYRRFGFGVVNLLTNLSMGVVRSDSRVSDTQSGFRLYSRTAIDSLATDTIGNDMSASTDILHHAHKMGYPVEEIGTTISYDVDHESSHHPLRHGIQLVGNLIRTIERKHPLSALGIPGFLSIAIAIVFVYWTFSNYLSTGTFPVGLAVVSGLFGLFGAFASFTAIILHSLETHYERTD
ncbi:glycosyltransferase family 2 protein [Salinigranum halophilum]|uniref:glycosyltransferase family 2 protein n=1 Tax=Salinigranum halophilum TaxID=2565931 RepID=UPI00115E5BC8|nr:glycosyltransferase family 2 protein [Salinigranum halophilum]